MECVIQSSMFYSFYLFLSILLCNVDNALFSDSNAYAWISNCIQMLELKSNVRVYIIYGVSRALFLEYRDKSYLFKKLLSHSSSIFRKITFSQLHLLSRTTLRIHHLSEFDTGYVQSVRGPFFLFLLLLKVAS